METGIKELEGKTLTEIKRYENTIGNEVLEFVYDDGSRYAMFDDHGNFGYHYYPAETT